MLNNFTYHCLPSTAQALEANKLIHQFGIKEQIYGCKPALHECYRGIFTDKDGMHKSILTSAVEKIYRLDWAVGMENRFGHTTQWWLIITASGTQYAIAETH